MDFIWIHLALQIMPTQHYGSVTLNQCMYAIAMGWLHHQITSTIKMGSMCGINKE